MIKPGSTPDLSAFPRGKDSHVLPEHAAWYWHLQLHYGHSTPDLPVLTITAQGSVGSICVTCVLLCLATSNIKKLFFFLNNIPSCIEVLS